MRLLIADSDPTLTDVYESFFSGEGYEVETVGDGLQCVEATRQRVPDALILEYELPWGGGDGVLAHLREDFRLMSIGVVLITSDYSENELANLFEPPVAGCLRKPFRLRELSEVVRSVMKHASGRTAGRLLKEMTVPSRRTVQR